MKKTLSVFFTCSLIVIVQLILIYSDANAITLNKLLFTIASDMNKQLPMIIGNEMESTRVGAIKHDLFFYYRFIDREKSQINLKQEKKNLYRTTRNGVCSTPETIEFLRKGVGEKFIYYDRNNIYLFDFYLTKKDCN